MKYLRQVAILAGICLVAELIRHLVPIPIPACIYGIVLLFILLLCKVIRPEHIRETSYFLIAIMPLMFVPPGVGLMSRFHDVKDLWLPLLIVITISTLVCGGVTGVVAQHLIIFNWRRGKKRE